MKSTCTSEGGFDAAMLELQREFLLGFPAPFLSEIHTPLISTVGTEPQENDLPPALSIQAKREEHE